MSVGSLTTKKCRLRNLEIQSKSSLFKNLQDSDANGSTTDMLSQSAFFGGIFVLGVMSFKLTRDFDLWEGVIHFVCKTGELENA